MMTSAGSFVPLSFVHAVSKYIAPKAADIAKVFHFFCLVWCPFLRLACQAKICQTLLQITLIVIIRRQSGREGVLDVVGGLRWQPLPVFVFLYRLFHEEDFWLCRTWNMEATCGFTCRTISTFRIFRTMKISNYFKLYFALFRTICNCFELLRAPQTKVRHRESRGKPFSREGFITRKKWKEVKQWKI